MNSSIWEVKYWKKTHHITFIKKYMLALWYDNDFWHMVTAAVLEEANYEL